MTYQAKTIQLNFAIPFQLIPVNGMHWSFTVQGFQSLRPGHDHFHRRRAECATRL